MPAASHVLKAHRVAMAAHSFAAGRRSGGEGGTRHDVVIPERRTRTEPDGSGARARGPVASAC
ncbi:hypothetical protein [Saccharothrix violaceirubra]|uniref:Uncharacterized protein n=1 Tax=Saccharothrix violaceirubra TaxID=413306 RepID=A0A7W7T9U0_9PSEU|nr:hypothetical protein [Saccharothrix violaceirubra]MBB4969171.1 hypothetical protein [Saccharothrix violaceirubra]